MTDLYRHKRDSEPKALPVKAFAAGGYHNLALKKDGSVVAWGDNQYGQSAVPENLGKVSAISAGGYHSIALQEDGQLVIWGRNDAGQANPPQGIRIAKPGIVDTDSLQIIARANDGSLNTDATITINLTNDLNGDADGDGLPNSVETNSGIFLSENETGTDPNTLADELREADDYVPIPNYAYDCHTREGRKRGKTKKDFFKAEQEALEPHQPGLFDELS